MGRKLGMYQTMADLGASTSVALAARGVPGMLTALLFRFPFPGPWGKDLTEAVHELARDIANEPGLVWKIWLENCETGHAGGIYLFEHAAAAERYREKHERRLSAMGFTGVTANTFSVNIELSVLTMAGAALGQTPASKSASTAAVAAPY
jgi:hypothetical protein